MRIIILVFLLFCSFINIANAYPVAVLLIWYDFLLLAIPFIVTTFSAIFFYFRKNIFLINLFLFFINIFLYFYYFFHIKLEILFSFEYLFFLIFIIIFWIIWKFKINFLNYILLFIFLGLFFVIWKLSYEIYDFKNIEKCIIKNVPNNLETKFLYKKSYIVVFGKNQNENTYVVIDKANLNNEKWVYYSSKNQKLWKILKWIWLNCVK